MNTIQYVMLSLLAREPLSGYDIKQQMNSRINYFYKINNNQLYPTLAKMEAEGLVQLHAHERESYRPAKKIYKITDEGLQRLKEWVVEPSEPESFQMEFLLKQYSSWLVDAASMIPLLEKKKADHEKQLAAYQEKIAELREQFGHITSKEPLFSSVAVVDMGMRFEQASIDWCEYMLHLFREELSSKE